MFSQEQSQSFFESNRAPKRRQLEDRTLDTTTVEYSNEWELLTSAEDNPFCEVFEMIEPSKSLTVPAPSEFVALTATIQVLTQEQQVSHRETPDSEEWVCFGMVCPVYWELNLFTDI
jgi:hypothetical protein